MTVAQQIATVGIIVFGTVFTRFISFIVFPAGKETPKFVKYLGYVLPAAVLGMLVVYCYKSIDFASAQHGIPELLAGALVAGLHLWKKNMLLSIAAGTIFYMIIIRIPVF